MKPANLLLFPATLALGVTSRAVRRMSYTEALARGRALGRIWFHAFPLRRRTVVEALTTTFVRWDRVKILATARGVFENVAANVVTLLWAAGGSGTVRDLSRIVRFDGWQHWRQARATGAVVATSHTGNWDLAALAAAQRGMALTVLSRNLSHAPTDRMWNRARRRSGLTILDDSADLGAIRTALGPRRAMALMCDQRTGPGQGGIPWPFFGRQAWTSTLAAAVSARAGVPILSATSRTAPDGRIEVCISGPITSNRTSAMAQLTEITGIIAGRLEFWILGHPESWLWMHRRWASETDRDR